MIMTEMKGWTAEKDLVAAIRFKADVIRERICHHLEDRLNPAMLLDGPMRCPPL